MTRVLRRVAAQRANGANGNEGENSPFNNGHTRPGNNTNNRGVEGDSHRASRS